MHGIWSRMCMRTISSVGVRRFKCESLLQNYRSLSVTSADLIRQSNINKNKDEDDENQASVKTTDENIGDKATGSSKHKSSGTWGEFTTKRYERFAESSARIIYDFDEEQRRLEEGLDTEQEENVREISLERGATGVFDIDELVDLLREDNARDIVVIKIPDEMKYVNYMVIVTSKSIRHINALSQLVRRVYKKKKRAKDRFCVIEGKNTGWVAMDLGNIALHIMNPEEREAYDLETLWTVGAQYDESCQEEEYQDPLELYNFNVQPVRDTFVSQLSDETRHNTSTSQMWEKNT